MVGIVVVSHSRALARAAVGLASEMIPDGSVRIEVAAGLDEDTFGTDAVAIAGAIGAADDGSGDGVVVLMDLGSAVLSAELALDLLDDPEIGTRVTLCPAPLVEGLVVAVVCAAAGYGRADIDSEASAALAGKRAQLGTSPSTAGSPGVEPPAEPPPGGSVPGGSVPGGSVPGGGGPEVAAEFSVVNAHGLHARPAARLVQDLGRFDATVTLRNLTTGAGPVPASSLSQVATLGAVAGHRLAVAASGPGARAAVDHVLAVAARGFDDEPSAAPSPAGAPQSVGAQTGAPQSVGAQVGAAPDTRPVGEHVGEQVGGTAGGTGGIAASPGIGVGPAWLLRSAAIVVPDEPAGEQAVEQERLRGAIEEVAAQLEAVRERTAATVGADEAGIFDAHLMFLRDRSLIDKAYARLAHEGAAPAWAGAVEEVAAAFDAIADPYLRARAADVRAVGEQVVRALLGRGEEVAEPVPAGSVVVAADLTPAQAARLDPTTAGLVLAFGSPTAHSAILARARGIPAVVGAGAGVLDVRGGVRIAIDGERGEIVVDPDEAVRADFADRSRRRRERMDRAAARAHGPALTRDGVRVIVAANVGSVADATVGAQSGAEGSGLVRTEFLFVDRADAPDVDEQEATYRAIAEALGGARITVRTLDVGGDKPLSYVPMPHEDNPFLGTRGLRLALARPALLRDQLTAVVRTARETPVSVMFPMVSTVSELARARALLDEVVAAEAAGRSTGLQVGIMVEVPAVALKAASFAPHVDFLSIGTNDLTQYALAADRGNDAVAGIGDPLDPGVLRLIRATGDVGGDATGKGGPLVAVCGELAADERATALLFALGVRELSVAPPAVGSIKEAVRAVDPGAAHALAARAVRAAGAQDVRALL